MDEENFPLQTLQRTIEAHIQYLEFGHEIIGSKAIIILIKFVLCFELLILGNAKNNFLSI